MSDHWGELRRRASAKEPMIMGILNATPDSFSDGGRYPSEAALAQRIDELLAEGADVIDIGGESTRPGAPPVSADEQKARVLGAVASASRRGALVSIDTTLPEVAAAACAAGARIVNDVSCLADRALARVAREHQAALLIMHSRGSMTAMAGFSSYPAHGYDDVVGEVHDELARARRAALDEGLAPEQVWVDPGLGFHKSAEHSYALLRHLERLSDLGPVVVGASRKSFLARDVTAAPAERLGGTVAACLAAARRGAAMLRVHDVRAVRQALAVERAIGREA